MRVINHRNVNEAFGHAATILRSGGIREETRNGPALVFPMPVTTVYKKPTERVLLWRPRGANPFFHLAEAMWMLAGRRDSWFPSRFVRDFGDRYAEPDGNLHGAYGHRWRRHFRRTEASDPSSDPMDQILRAIDMLSEDPTTRRCVISMWDPTVDLGADRRDIPCNTHIYLSVRFCELDMLVSCRSNDAVWGAYGANIVHFSILQEFIASRLGIPVGHLRQVSYNLHVYESVLDRLPEKPIPNPYMTPHEPEAPVVSSRPLFEDGRSFLSTEEWLDLLETWVQRPHLPPAPLPLFDDLLVPMMRVYDCATDTDLPAEARRNQALRLLDEVGFPDWREAMRLWVEGRIRL